MIHPCPKPAQRERSRPKWLPRSTKPIARSPLKRGTKPLPKVNPKRQARRLKAYRAHLASAYWKALRLQAYQRDGGLCWCPECVEGRRNGEVEAFELIAIWYDVKGGIHGFSTHHVTYARFTKELLSDVLTMHVSRHNRLESQTGKRARFLTARAQS